MIARMRSMLGWLRGRFGNVGARPDRPRRDLARVPSGFDALERREVLSTATFAPYATIPESTPAITSVAAAGSASYLGQPTVESPAAVQSAIAPVYYSGQPVIPSSTAGISAINADTDYVQALYRTVLNRVGTPSEVALWVSDMQKGVTIPQVATDFVDSVEHREDEVDSYYQDFLHQTPDATAQALVNAFLAGASEELVVGTIIDGPVYQAAHADPGQFVQGLYNDVLGRTADPAGYAEWQAAVGAGGSRAAVVANFVDSSEAIDQVIDNYYEDYLHRAPDLAGAAAWASVLEAPGGSASSVAIGILSSPEFIQDSQQG